MKLLKYCGLLIVFMLGWLLFGAAIINFIQKYIPALD